MIFVIPFPIQRQMSGIVPVPRNWPEYRQLEVDIDMAEIADGYGAEYDDGVSMFTYLRDAYAALELGAKYK